MAVSDLETKVRLGMKRSYTITRAFIHRREAAVQGSVAFRASVRGSNRRSGVNRGDPGALSEEGRCLRPLQLRRDALPPAAAPRAHERPTAMRFLTEGP